MEKVIAAFGRIGITQADLARLFSVSRVSVHHWSRGRVPSLRQSEKGVKLTLALLRKAKEAGELPLQMKSPEERVKELRRLLKKYAWQQ